MSVSTLSRPAPTSIAAGYAGAVVTVLIWAIWVLATRHIASTSLTAIDAGLIRYGVPMLVLAPVCWRTGLLPKGVPLRLIIVMVAGAGALFFQLTAFALHSTSAAAGGILLGGSMPLATALIGVVLFGERPDRMRIVGLVAIVAGLAILLGKALLSGGMTPAGFLMLPLGGLLWAGYTHAYRRSGLTPLQGAAVITGWSTVIHLVLAAIFGTSLAAAPLSELAIQITSQGILSGLVATFAYGTAIRALGGTQAAAFTAITPVLVTLGGGLLLGEPLGLTELFAAVVTGAGVALSTGILSKRA